VGVGAGVVVSVNVAVGGDEETVTKGESAGDDDPVEELHPETSTRKAMKKMQMPA